MNRRNVLLGLGTIVAGGGAALGSGAFSQAEAQRSVSVSLEGDSSGLLRPSVNASEYEGVESGTETRNSGPEMNQVKFVGINDESVFAFDDVLQVSLQSETDAKVSGTFDISISTDAGSVAVYKGSFPDNASRDDTGSNVTDVNLGAISVSDNDDSTDSVAAGIAINTNPAEEDGNRFDATLDDGSTADITITAQQQNS
ncbi:hypothetical protein DVR14_10980 [Natrinema thermotolerans]|nr:hypothetical protein DVR14_10980 [Natrinema thermotolerans]